MPEEPAPIPPRAKRRWFRRIFLCVLAGMLALGGYSFWRAHDYAAAVREAAALGWEWQQISTLELLKEDWKNAFKGETWRHHPVSLNIQNDEDLSRHRSLLHRLRPERLHLCGCKHTEAVQGLRSVVDLTIVFSPELRSAELRKALTGLRNLRVLWLGGCEGLEDTDALAELPQLKELSLPGCEGLKGAGALKGLAGLSNLKILSLDDCTGLEDIAELEALHQLDTLSLKNCTGLQGEGALKGLAGMGKLRELWLDGCEGLKREKVLAQLKQFGLKCTVIGP